MDPEPAQFLSFIGPLIVNGDINIIAGNLLLFIFLLILSALVSGSEVAFFSLSVSEIRQLEDDNSDSAKKAIQLRSAPENLLATILILNNFINIAIVLVADSIFLMLIGIENLELIGNWFQTNVFGGYISGSTFARALNFFITVIGVTFLLVLFGEAIPKIYATVNKIKLVHLMASPLNFFSKLVSPISSILVGWSTIIEKKLKKNSSQSSSKEDLAAAIELTVGIEKDSAEREAGILKGIVAFGDTSAKQIMKTRLDMVALDVQAQFKEVMKIVKDSGYSRLPVYKDELDVIIGILYVKDLIAHSDKTDDFNWQKLIRKNILFVPESKKIDELLKEFQSKRTHMAIVVDEYGGVQGLATLEDILEEVIGEIHDEFDQEEEVEYTKISDIHFIFDGKTLLNDVCRLTGISLSAFEDIRNDSDSLAGLILEILEYIPEKDEEIVHEFLKFKILAVTQRRIEKISIEIENAHDED